MSEQLRTGPARTPINEIVEGAFRADGITRIIVERGRDAHMLSAEAAEYIRASLSATPSRGDWNEAIKAAAKVALDYEQEHIAVRIRSLKRGA